MKKFLLSIFALMLAVFSVQAEEATLSFANKAQRTSFSSTKQVWEQNGVTFTNNKSSSTNAVADYAKPVRLYANSQLIVEYTSGNITKIVFDCNSSSYATALKNSIGTAATASSDKVTVTLDGKSNSFTVAKLTAQVRLDALTVTYTTAGEGGGETPEPEQPKTPVAPTLPASCNFDNAMTVEITNNAESATVYYTTDESEPSANNGTKYTGPFEITETTTVKAIAVNEGDSSEVVSAKYTKNEPVTPPAEGVSVIVFNKKDSDATNALSDDNFVSDGIASTNFESLSCTETGKCYVGTNGIKMGSSSANGTFTLNLGANYNVKTITVNAVKWGSDNATLKVNGATERNLTNSATDYVFDVNSTINQIKVDMTKRGYVAKIMVELNTSAEAVVIDAPTLTAGATFNETATVEITNNAEGTTLYYSYDDVNYEEYIGALTITETTTVYAYAKDDDGNKSEKVSETYKIIKSSVGYYVKVASEPADWTGKYLVVYEDKATAYVFNGKDQANGYVTASIDGAIIKANSEIDAVAVTIAAMENGYSVNTADGYIYGAEGSNALNFSTTKKLNTIAMGADGVDINAGRYLRFNSSSGDMRFRYYNNTFGKPVQLYKYVTELPSYQLSVTSAGWATLYLDFNAQIPTFEGEDAGAYIVTGVKEGNWLQLVKVEGVLPANTGILVKADAKDGGYTFKYTATATANVDGNLLKGTTKKELITKDANKEYYALGLVDNIVCFYNAVNGDNENEFYNNAFKAYLEVENVTGGVPSASLRFDFGGTTAIEEVETEATETVIYDLTGRRVNEITKAGVYIINGKKILVK